MRVPWPTLVAHSGGFGWDEAVVFALPVLVLVVLQVLGRRKAARDAEQDGGEDDEGTGAG